MNNFSNQNNESNEIKEGTNQLDEDFMRFIESNQQIFDKCLELESNIYHSSNDEQNNIEQGQLNIIENAIKYIQDNRQLKYIQFKDLIEHLTSKVDQSFKQNNQMLNLQGAYIPSNSKRINITVQTQDQGFEIGKQLKAPINKQ